MPVTIVGNNTPTAGGVVYGDGTNYVSTSAGTAGQVLQSNGSGAPTWATLAEGSLILLSSITASASSTVVFTGINSTYDNYLILASNVTAGTSGGQVLFQVSSDGGSSYVTAGYLQGIAYNSSSYVRYDDKVTASRGVIHYTPGMNTGDLLMFSMTLSAPSSSNKKLFQSIANMFNGGNEFMTIANGALDNTTTYNAIKIYNDAGTISGSFQLYGIKKS